MSALAFDTAFAELVAPVLERLGFRRIARPDGWIIPNRLYEREGTWFSAEWDERDGWLAATVGRLFRLRDFMPRAIVRGPFSYEVSGQYGAVLNHHLGEVAAALPDAVAHLAEQWPSTPALERERWARTKQGEVDYARYLAALGPELTDWPLGPWATAP